MGAEDIKLTRRRSGRSSKEIKDLLQSFEQSGEDVRVFCQAHNLALSTFQKWKSRYGKKEVGPAKEESFVSLQVSPVAADGIAAGLFAEVRDIKLYQPEAASYLKELFTMSSIITLSDTRRHYLCRKETDMRKSFDSLCGIVSSCRRACAGRVIVIEPSADITGCKKMGEEITEVLEYQSGELYVKQ